MTLVLQNKLRNTTSKETPDTRRRYKRMKKMWIGAKKYENIS